MINRITKAGNIIFLKTSLYQNSPLGDGNDKMKIDFKKYSDGLVPAVVQDYKTNKVLMLGFMNNEALQKTEQTRVGNFL